MRKARFFVAVLLVLGLLFQYFMPAAEAAARRALPSAKGTPVVQRTRPDSRPASVVQRARPNQQPASVIEQARPEGSPAAVERRNPPRLGGIPEVVKPSREGVDSGDPVVVRPSRIREYSVVVQPPQNSRTGGTPVIVQPDGRGRTRSGQAQPGPQKPVPIALVVTPSSVTVEQGKSATVRVVLKYSNGSEMDVTGLFSLDAGVAKLEKGVVTGLEPSKGTFTLAYEGLQAVLTVEVVPPPPFGIVAPPDLSSRVQNCTVSWRYSGRNLRLAIGVPADLLRYDREIQSLAERSLKDYRVYMSLPSESVVKDLMKDVYSHYNVASWVTERYNYGFLSGVADQLEKRFSGFGRYELAQITLAMVQSLGYHIVNPPQLPVQTLVEGGDCDGLSVLYAALLRNMGYDVALFYYRPGVLDPEAGHMLVGVALSDNELPQGGKYEYVERDGKKYYYAETTSTGWRIGEDSVGVAPSAVYVVN